MFVKMGSKVFICALPCLIYTFFNSGVVEGELIVESFNASFNPRYNTNRSYINFSKTETKGVYAVTVLMENIVPFNKITLTGSLSYKSNPKSSSYDRIMLNKKISLCSFIGQENFVVTWMLQIMKQYANFELKCPFRTGNHTLKAFPIDGSIFPPITPEMHFRIYFFMSAQVPGLTSTKQIYSVFVTGQLKWT